MTYQDIIDEDVLSIVSVTGFETPLDLAALARKAENEYIKQTGCLETVTEIDTTAVNGGVLTNLYDLPASFVEEFRVEWDGRIIEPVHVNIDIRLTDTDNITITGYPAAYWIENGKLRLNCVPTEHSVIKIWHSFLNSATDGTSPVIPAADHIYLADWILSRLYRMESSPFKDINIAENYMAKFLARCEQRNEFYNSRRFKQERVEDTAGGWPGYKENSISGPDITLDI